MKCEICVLRSRIQSLKIKISLQNLKKEGKTLGRPPKYSERLPEILDLKLAGNSLRTIAKNTGIPRNTIMYSLKKLLNKNKYIYVNENNIKELETLSKELKQRLKGESNGN